ncbi:hypothetical protein PsAD2_03753 [Pseudovibrio axinellae]|uniref:Uncharacterized protein n=1 Tax=Pseudovibrio axinellae TaxID=989403 RepID=A0A165VMF4_9HYPH|nr:hypothetical protein PsAD2_03753 [Pseudovibrio axinellae]SER85252.1 hypothetical protein SAMN05421798_1385 [Pseudovibrio axinellae]
MKLRLHNDIGYHLANKVAFARFPTIQVICNIRCYGL